MFTILIIFGILSVLHKVITRSKFWKNLNHLAQKWGLITFWDLFHSRLSRRIGQVVITWLLFNSLLRPSLWLHIVVHNTCGAPCVVRVHHAWCTKCRWQWLVLATATIVLLFFVDNIACNVAREFFSQDTWNAAPCHEVSRIVLDNASSISVVHDLCTQSRPETFTWLARSVL